jgi:pyruvate,water dikinase
MALLVFFDEPAGADVAMVGGKGCNLSALTRAGFPVPPGFVVTAEAYGLFLDAIPSLGVAIASFDYDHPETLRQQCTRLIDELSAVPLPAAAREAVAAGLVRLGRGAYAVRSSSTFEDLAQAAFAGQHETYLNIEGLDAICEKVRDCFVSLWGDRAVLYRRHQGFDQLAARMAVVVQRQVACDVAGVGFSVDPVTGRPDRLVIDAAWGLGERVVSGAGEVDHFVLDKKTFQLLDRAIGHKATLLAPAPGGVGERPVPAERVDQPSLTEEQVREVARLLLKAEAHFGWPQDIEWGIEAGRLYQLQSRPVTTLPPRWTRDTSAERFPRPMTPLMWDLLEDAFRASATWSLAVMGLPPVQADWFGLFDYYIYGNQNAVELLAAYRPLRARTPGELAAEIPELRRRYAWVLDLPLTWARDLDRYLMCLGRLASVPLDGGPRALWDYLVEVTLTAIDYFRPNLAITTTVGFLHQLLHHLVALVVGAEKALPIVDGLLAGCDTKTVIVNRELHELACLAATTPELVGELHEQGGRAFWKVDRLAQYPAFAARLHRFLEDHGHREMDMDHYHPTWSGQPWVVLDAVGMILRGGLGEHPAEISRRLRLRYTETEHQFLAAVPHELRFFFRELIRLARTYTLLDDLEHYQTTRVNPVTRRLLLALGGHLLQAGVIDTQEDIFFFRRDDLSAMVRSWPEVDVAACRQKVLAAKAGYEAALAKSPPWSLEEAATGFDDKSECLRGLPGSPGRVTGPVFRVHAAEDFARFPKGAVLVAPTTNPAWTPLFYSACGLVTESGGPLSHGAVTAREMHLPAVMSVRGVMTLLHDGQAVTVDGTRGEVRIDFSDEKKQERT